MKKYAKLLVKPFLSIVGLVALAFIGLFVFSTLTNYNPPDSEVIYKSTKPAKQLDTAQEISLIIWNIGYCGLGEDMDFFYDGGTKVRATEEITLLNMNKIGNFLMRNDADFILLQELDVNSKRTYNINELDSFQNRLMEYKSYFALNYNVKFVPLPFSNPMGKTYAGLATFSKSEPTLSTRYAYKSEFSWPKNLYMLDRCFLVNRHPLANGKELLVINTHNSAYDKTGELKKKELDILRNYLQTEYQKGNYIVVGGDWNQLPPKYAPDFENNLAGPGENTEVFGDFIDSKWDWVYDNKTPTNRDLNLPFTANKTATRVIDFFLVSPNIQTVSIKGFSLNFESSDHNPVKILIKLK